MNKLTELKEIADGLLELCRIFADTGAMLADEEETYAALEQRYSDWLGDGEE